MEYWSGGGLLTLLCLALVLGISAAVRSMTGIMDRWAIPDCMLAGVLGLLLGPQLLGLLPMDTRMLELIVYHGLAVVYLSVGLQTPDRAADAASQGDIGARSVALAVPTNAVAQGVFGLLLVLGFSALGPAVHPGLGMLFPLAWNQGPGQAMSLGRAWEQSGLQDGGQLGLILATSGLLFAVVTGAPLVAWGRRRGWVGHSRSAARALQTQADGEAQPAEGALEPLTAHIALVGVLYGGVYLALRALSGALADKPQAAATMWGFHFLLAVGIALLARVGLRRALGRSPLSNRQLGRIAGVTVDWTTAAAVSAVQLSVLRSNLGFIAACIVLGGAFTILICLWVGKRAFNREPFEHAVVLYGIATGTLTTGLALLRVMDPEMRGGTASNFVIGSTAAALGGLPLLAIMNVPILGWPDRFVPSVLLTLGLLVLYLGVLMLIWMKLGAFRWLRPLHAVWPEQDWPAPADGAAQEAKRSEA